VVANRCLLGLVYCFQLFHAEGANLPTIIETEDLVEGQEGACTDDGLHQGMCKKVGIQTIVIDMMSVWWRLPLALLD
jgi:hypothetical protein